MSRSPKSHAGLAKALQTELKDDPATLGVKAFARQAAADAQPEEVAELGAQGLAKNLADFWRFAEKRRGRGPQTRLALALGDDSHILDRLEKIGRAHV